MPSTEQRQAFKLKGGQREPSLELPVWGGGRPSITDQWMFPFSPVRGTVVSVEGSELGFQRLTLCLFVRFIKQPT